MYNLNYKWKRMRWKTNQNKKYVCSKLAIFSPPFLSI